MIMASATPVITGTGSYFPGAPLSNEALEKALCFPVVSAMSYFGISNRHFAVDVNTGERLEPGLGTTEMAARAAELALEEAGLAPSSIDLIITNTTSADESLPLMYSQLQRRLGLGEVFGLDIRGGCSASVQSLHLASTLMRSGLIRRALIVSSECISPYCYTPLLGRKNLSLKRVINGIIFGDGAGAIVVEREDVITRPKEVAMKLSCTDARSVLPDEPFGFQLSTPDGKVSTQHNHKTIERVVPQIIARAFAELRKVETTADFDSDVLLVPQVNQTMIELIDPELLASLEARSLLYCGDEIGSVPTAGVPIALDKALRSGFIDAKSRVQIVAVDTASWSYSFVELLP